MYGVTFYCSPPYFFVRGKSFSEPGALHFSHTEWLHCLVLVLQVCNDVVDFYVGPGIGTQLCMLV